MKNLKYIYALLLLSCCSLCYGQKTAAGIRFNECLNKKDLAKDFYKGKYVVLDFWATWCAPCIASFPKLNKLEKKYHDRSNLIFAAITHQSVGAADSFFNRKDLIPGVLHLVDTSRATSRYFDIASIPQIIVFSPSGAVIFTGHVDRLKEVMDKLLAGQTVDPLIKLPPAGNSLETMMSKASFMTMIVPSDTPGATISNSSRGPKSVSVNMTIGVSTLANVVGYIGSVCTTRLSWSDSVKANKYLTFYYRQNKDNFHEFDKGLFKYQYQNHMMNILEKAYSFHCEWVTEKTTVKKLIVVDSALLAKSLTMSTAGSLRSRIFKGKVNFVNMELAVIADAGEENFESIMIADTTSTGYDMELDMTNMATFIHSLSQHGLALDTITDYPIEKLKMVFE